MNKSTVRLEDDPLYQELLREILHKQPSLSIKAANWMAEQKWKFFTSEYGKTRIAHALATGCTDEASARKRAYASWHIDNNVCF